MDTIAVWSKGRTTVDAKYVYVWWSFVVVGILQRLRQYVVNRSLWYDEASLALNFGSRSFAELTAPLDHNQAAPIGFLFIEKLFFITLGNKDYILRLFPLFCGLIAVYLMYRIASQYAGNFGLFSLLMFNISWPLISYSSELKQYSVDVAVAVFIVFYAFRFAQENAKGRDFLGLTIIGIISMWLSHPSIYILAGLGITLMYRRLMRRSSQPFGWLLAVGGSWTLNLWIIYNVSVQQLAANDYLQQFWRNDFMPMPLWDRWDWLGAAYLKLLSAITGVFLPLPWYFVLLYSITITFGIMAAGDNDRNQFTTSLIVISIPLMLMASALHLYPIKGRLLLFLAPFIYLLITNGLKQIYLLVGKWNGPISRILVSLLILGIAWKPALLAVQNLISPPLGEHIKPGLAYLQQNWQDNDIIYVYYGAEPAFEYYQASFGFDSAHVIHGVMSQDDPGKYIEDIKKLQGHDRVWFLFTHNCDACIVHEQRRYIQYLNKIGTTISKFHGQGVNVYLYNLNP